MFPAFNKFSYLEDARVDYGIPEFAPFTAEPIQKNLGHGRGIRVIQKDH
jgi:hypothetical protein